MLNTILLTPGDFVLRSCSSFMPDGLCADEFACGFDGLFDAPGAFPFTDGFDQWREGVALLGQDVLDPWWNFGIGATFDNRLFFEFFESL